MSMLNRILLNRASLSMTSSSPKNRENVTRSQPVGAAAERNRRLKEHKTSETYESQESIKNINSSHVLTNNDDLPVHNPVYNTRTAVTVWSVPKIQEKGIQKGIRYTQLNLTCDVSLILQTTTQYRDEGFKLRIASHTISHSHRQAMKKHRPYNKSRAGQSRR